MASVDLQEKANFTKLSRLLVDKGTEALRNTFDSIHSPARLPAVLNANRKSLLRLKFRVINNSQWDLLFPPSGNPPDSKTFDVTLLTVLFRNICGLPSTGWDAMPVDTDRSMQANIVRLKSFRNQVYAHVTSTQVDNATFESLWQKISQALIELNIPQNDIDDLETSPLGSEEEIYVEILKEWKSQEEESMKVLEVLTSIAEESRDGIKKLQQSVLEQQSDIQALQRSVNHSSQFVKDKILEKTCRKESDDDLLRKLAKHNFKGKIVRKVKLFHPGTREWLLKEVDEFVEYEQEATILLLTAGPGFGKSVFAAKVCEDFKRKGKLAASHFCDFNNSNLRDAMIMLESLASQMCENIAGFKEKLLDQLRRPYKVRNIKDAFRIYLQNPLDELELEEPYLVVMDGLDESEANDKNEIVTLIADYFPDLPDCITVLVTSRPEISIANLSSVQKIHIKHDDAENNSDLQVYLKDCLPRLADRNGCNSQLHRFLRKNSKEYGHIILSLCDGGPGLEDIVFKMLAERCEGSFLYAFHVQLQLNKCEDLEKMTYDDIFKILPEGLDSIYEGYFKRLEDELKDHGHFDVFRILEILAASKGPLPIKFITRALGLAPDCRETKKIINKVNETISSLLYVSDDLVTVFHKSVIDWLLGEGHEYTVKVSDGNKSLWLICEHVFEEIRKTVCSGDDLSRTNDVNYALEYGPQHLVACKMRESFFWLVDVVIVHALLTAIKWHYHLRSIFKMWLEILQGPVVIDDKLRARISWHFIEIDYVQELHPKELFHSLSCNDYLESVLAHSPEGYFSDDEKKIAKSLLSKGPWFVEFNFHQVEVMPLSVWRIPFQESGIIQEFMEEDPEDQEDPTIRAIGLSYDKTMAAFAQRNGEINVISVPRLDELWQYSTEYKRISCCTFAPDSSFVLFGKLETVLNIAERKEVPFFHGNKETFRWCAFSPNGKRLVTSDGSSTIKLWDVAKRSLLSLLCAEVPVNWCSFSSTGLFIFGDWIRVLEDSPFSVSKFQESDAFCVWNAITWQRSDERNLPDVKAIEIVESDLEGSDSDSEGSNIVSEDSSIEDGEFRTNDAQSSDERNLPDVKSDEGKIIRSKLCHRCFRPGSKELDTCKMLKIEPSPRYGEAPWPAGVYNGMECIFALDDQHLSVMENTHFNTLAVWNIFVHSQQRFYTQEYFRNITLIKDDLWFYADMEKLIVFKTLVPTQQEASCLPRPTRVLSSSFSPDGSRLATCTSDGCINIWNVDTGQIEQRFKSSQGESSFACWWSKDFLFVFDFFHRIPSLSKYPMAVNLKILFTQSQQVLLCHLVDEFIPLSAVVDFAEGLLSFKCGETKPVKVLDVSGVGEPRMVTLPGIEPGMSITVSPSASFVFGVNESSYYIWKRNVKEETDVYEVFFTESTESSKSARKWHECCFSNDSEVAVVLDKGVYFDSNVKVFHLDTGDHKRVCFSIGFGCTKLLCLNKDRLVVDASNRLLRFFDMDSGARLKFSFQRYLTTDLIKQLKLSPKETMIAFPKINGDMEFLRLCIPQSSVLSSIKREEALEWHLSLIEDHEWNERYYEQ